MQEDWMPIIGFEHLYRVSSLGNIFSLRRRIFLNPSDNGRGYQYVTLRKDNKGYNRYVHRLVAESFLKPDNERLDVNHKDGIKANNNVENLEWCDKFENMRHAYANNLLYNPAAKLTKLEVDILRKMWSVGVHREHISKVFNISFAQISRITTQKAW